MTAKTPAKKRPKTCPRRLDAPHSGTDDSAPMGGNIVLNIVRTTFAAIIAVFLLILVGQRNQIEDRLGSIQEAQKDSEKRDGKTARDLKALRGKIDRVEKSIKSGVVVAKGSASATNRTHAPVASGDPRTLPYWKTDDNILVDFTDEPRAPADAPEGGEINFFISSNMRTLNPYVDSDADQQDRIVSYVYETLAGQSLANPANYIPGLANRVTVSEDKKVFTVYLRKGVMWHKPTLSDEQRHGALAWLADMPRQEMTAHDVKFTFDIVRNSKSEVSALSSYFEGFDRIEVINSHELKVHWETASYYNQSTSLALMSILPRFIFQRGLDGTELAMDAAALQFQKHWYNKRMCGTGPLQFEQFKDNSFIRLERNPEYWGEQPKFDALVLKIVLDPEMRLSLFKRGEIDLFEAQPAQWRSDYLEGGDKSLKSMEASGQLTLHRPVGFMYRYIGWNQKRPMFRDRALRRALAHCFPKERICRDVYYGLSKPHDGPVHPDTDYYVQDLEAFPYNIKKAAELLDAAGWKLNANGVREKIVGDEKKELRFKILIPNSVPAYRDFSLVYQKELAKVGVILDLEPREWQKMKSKLENKDFDACALGWGLSYDTDPSQIWHPREAEKPRSSNQIAYQSTELGEVIDALRIEFDPAKRTELQQRFQRIIVGDQPYLFMTVPKLAWFVSNRLGGQSFNAVRPQVFFMSWYVKDGE